MGANDSCNLSARRSSGFKKLSHNRKQGQLLDKSRKSQRHENQLRPIVPKIERKKTKCKQFLWAIIFCQIASIQNSPNKVIMGPIHQSFVSFNSERSTSQEKSSLNPYFKNLLRLVLLLEVQYSNRNH